MIILSGWHLYAAPIAVLCLSCALRLLSLGWQRLASGFNGVGHGLPGGLLGALALTCKHNLPQRRHSMAAAQRTGTDVLDRSCRQSRARGCHALRPCTQRNGCAVADPTSLSELHLVRRCAAQQLTQGQGRLGPSFEQTGAHGSQQHQHQHQQQQEQRPPVWCAAEAPAGATSTPTPTAACTTTVGQTILVNVAAIGGNAPGGDPLQPPASGFIGGAGSPLRVYDASTFAASPVVSTTYQSFMCWERMRMHNRGTYAATDHSLEAAAHAHVPLEDEAGGIPRVDTPMAAAAVVAPSRRRRYPAYCPFIRRASTLTKIPGYEPAQITQGYEQRLALLFSALEGSSGRDRRLAGIYVRSGCVELLLEAEEWGLRLFLGKQQAEGDEEGEQGLLGVQQRSVGLPAEDPGAAAAVAGGGEPGGGSGSGDADWCARSGSSLSSMDLASIIRALQLRDDQIASVMEDDGGSLSGDSGPDSGLGAQGPPPDGAGADDPQHADPAEQIRKLHTADGPPAGVPPVELSDSRQPLAPLALGTAGEQRAGVHVAALQPRVLLLPTLTRRQAAAQQVDEQQRQPQQQQRSEERQGQGQQHHQPSPVLGSREAASQDTGDSRSAAAPQTGTPGPVMCLRAGVSCMAALAPGDAPSELEVLLRCHNRYLPIRACWCLQDADDEPAGSGSGSEWGQALGVHDARSLHDAAADMDVNRLQLLELELLELPQHPGIALVDFRWRGLPCRAVPLVITAVPAVAVDLQAAVATWSRPEVELDELLLDIGTWEFHVSAIDAGASVNAAAPPSDVDGCGLDPVNYPRLLALGAHLLHYVSACGWAQTAGHISRTHAQLVALRAGEGAHSELVTGGGGFGAAGMMSSPPSAQPAEGPGGVLRSRAVPSQGARRLELTVHDSAAVAEPNSSELDGGEAAIQKRDAGDSGGVAVRNKAHRRGATSPHVVPFSWTCNVLLPALGFCREPAEEEERAFQKYAAPWILAQAQILLFLDLVSLVALTIRARHNVLDASTVTTLVACAMGAATVLARPFLPHRAWARLAVSYRLPRFLFYATSKGLIALCGFPVPLGVRSYAIGPGLLLMEGVILPGSSLLPPATAAVVLSVLATMTTLMLLACGATQSPGTAALIGARTAACGLITTVACHVYMRVCFCRRAPVTRRAQLHPQGFQKG